MEATQEPNTIPQESLEQDLSQLMHAGKEGVDAVAFRDGEPVGEPLGLSRDARHRIYLIALYDLTRQLRTRQSEMRLA